MVWVRIDNRLIHGQVVETWLPYLGAKFIIVADDRLAKDHLQQEIMSLAIPGNTRSAFVEVAKINRTLTGFLKPRKADVIVLFSNCLDAYRAFDEGFSFETLNVGNVHYSPGKRQLSSSVSLNEDEERCLHELAGQGVSLDFRCVPNDPVQVRF